MPTTKLFVGNIPYSSSEQDLKDLFGQSGATVASARVITDFDTGRSKGYAFVEMATPEEAAKAIAALNGFNLNGRNIVVSEAKAKTRPGSGAHRERSR